MRTFVIRTEQMRALSLARADQFVVRMARHMRTSFPDWSRGRGGSELDSFVRHGMKQSAQYGFTSELQIARYLLVMQALGMRFDEAPEHAWARNLLVQNLPVEEKLNRLMDAAHYQVEARRIRDAH